MSTIIGREHAMTKARAKEEAPGAASVEGHSTNAITLLIEEHRAVDAVFVELEALTPEDDGRAMTDLLRQVIDSLSVHAAMEEEVFYPAIRGLLAEGDSLADVALDEHQGARELMRDLASMDASEPGYASRVARLINEVRHHVNEEEHQILSKLRTVVGEPQLEELGRKLEDARAQLGRETTAAALIEAGAAEPVESTEQLVEELFEASRAPAASESSDRRGGGGAGLARVEVVYHVAPSERGGWAVRADGAKRISSHHSRKAEAVVRGRELARRRSARLVVHRQDGSIQQETEYAG
jgi:hemerythrin superfamily protein